MYASVKHNEIFVQSSGKLIINTSQVWTLQKDIYLIAVLDLFTFGSHQIIGWKYEEDLII